MIRAVLLSFLLTSPLQFAAPPELAPIQKRLESIDPKRFADIAETVGLIESGPPIQVVLAPETAAVAHEVPPWVAGFASSPSDMVVLFPARTPSYPNSSLEDVLRHEVAHIWIGRASGQRPIPRWFNEGLAMSVERGWRLQDEGELVYQLAVGSQTSLTELDRMFDGSQTDVTRAYALAGALVHDLLQQHGPRVGAGILMRMNEGASFDHAFTETVGSSPEEADFAFWERHHAWTEWLPTLTSSAMLWLGITGLALLAILRHVMKNRAIAKRWAAEEKLEEEKLERDEPNDLPN